MPPRSAKKAAGPGTKRAARGRGTPKAAAAQPQPEVVDEPVKDEEVKEEVKIETVSVEVKEVVEDKNLVDDDDDDDDKVEEKLVQSGLNSEKKEEDTVKESVEEYEKGERLDFGDNDPEEYEPEEYGAVDYDEKEIEQEDVQEEVDDLEEEIEDGDVGEEEEEEEEGEGDMAEEELEEAPEELDGEEDEENAEEHTEMVDTEEREEHRNVYQERRKRKEFEIFVGGLDKDATEDDLRKVFREVGEVTEVRLMMNAQTKKNKGFAFLRFATVEQAKRAAEMKNPVVNGKQCGVTPSQDSDTLFLGNICKSWTKEALKEKLKHYEVDTLEDLTLVEDSNNEGMNRGFAFLEFSSRSDAMDAFKRLQKRDVMFGVDRPAKVSFAAQIDPDDKEMAQVTTIFVDGLPASWDEDRVRELLKKYGEVVKIELARNMPSAKRKDFGFVTFGTHNEAVACANSINNETLGEGDSTAKVRARLSRPLQRGRGNFAPRGDFRPGRAAPGGLRSPWARPVPRSLPVRGVSRARGRLPPIVDRGFKRPVGFIRDRRPVTAMPPRARPVAPLSRSYDRRPPVPSYPKSSMKRDYGRREELPPRSRAAADYGPRGVSSERRSSYRDEYPVRGSAYSDLPRSTSRPSARRAYTDDSYGPRFERPPPSYREGRPRDYDSVSGSKRPYSALDDVPPRYAEAGVRQSRARYDYELGSGSSQYGDAYSDRMGRSNVGYSSSRSSISSQESPGLYSSRQGMAYGGGSYSGSDGGGMYSSYGGDYVSRGGDAGGSSYSSVYSSRSLGGGSYMGSGGSGSYY